MADDDELRRRIERLEGIQAELQLLMRESTLMIKRLNDTLVELKAELAQTRETEKEVAKMKVSLSVTTWVGATIGTTGLGLVLAYLFRVSP